ncbi:MAG: DUF2799 domain-containing protein [Pseudomonadota bacterium]
MNQSVTSRFARAGILSLGFLLASGCASMQQVDCNTADWFSVGLTDGSNGMQASRASEHQAACETSPNSFDTGSYKLGHENGLERYCTTESGLTAGLTGRAYRGVCSAESEKQFLSGYLLGSSSRPKQPSLFQNRGPQ